MKEHKMTTATHLTQASEPDMCPHGEFKKRLRNGLPRCPQCRRKEQQRKKAQRAYMKARAHGKGGIKLTPPASRDWAMRAANDGHHLDGGDR